MTTATLTLSDFLLARIAEDEEVARAAADDVAVGDEDGSKWYAWEADSEGIALLANIPAHLREPGETSPRTAHITRWDPARVLAECDAKRRMFVALASAHAASEVWLTGGRNEILAITDQALRLMALPYADHADYREEWRV